MWPWGHLSLAYLALRLLRMATSGHDIEGQEVWVLAFGALFPDLVDKTFSWTVPVLGSGRSLTHSVLTILLVAIALHWLLNTPRYRARAGVFLIGWASHLLADAIPGLLAGEAQAIFFWNWPFGPHPIYTTDPSYVAHFRGLGHDIALLTQGQFGEVGFLVYELLLVAVTLVIWVRDGSPGLEYVHSVASSVYARAVGN